jgi:CRISPR-associated protein Cas2
MLGSLRIVWLMCMFDLPVMTPDERRAAQEFRLGLLDQGFLMSQFSVYLKYCPSRAAADAVIRRVERILPEGGKVDILLITDKQYGDVKSYRKRIRQPGKTGPEQFVLI